MGDGSMRNPLCHPSDLATQLCLHLLVGVRFVCQINLSLYISHPPSCLLFHYRERERKRLSVVITFWAKRLSIILICCDTQLRPHITYITTYLTLYFNSSYAKVYYPASSHLDSSQRFIIHFDNLKI